MPTPVASKISEIDWLTHWRSLKRLWLEEKKKIEGEHGVVETMKKEYNFSAS